MHIIAALYMCIMVSCSAQDYYAYMLQLLHTESLMGSTPPLVLFLHWCCSSIGVVPPLVSGGCLLSDYPLHGH